MKPILITDWHVSIDNPFRAPEEGGQTLVGNVIGHPRKEDGKRIRTSTIVRTEGKRVYTASGNVYELGQVSNEYKAWIDEHYPNWDPENPIPMKG